MRLTIRPAFFGLLIVLLGTSLGGCTLLIPGTMPHERSADAVDQERHRCDAEPVDPRLYSPAIVERVSPHYGYVMGGPNGRETHLTGADLEVRPLPGVTAEVLERGLMCRSAKLVLQHASPLPSEPYFLPDGWVKVDVHSGNGSFVISLIAEDDVHGREILDRAQGFVEPR